MTSVSFKILAECPCDLKHAKIQWIEHLFLYRNVCCIRTVTCHGLLKCACHETIA